MSVFPKLKTGVVAQYPALREGEFSTAVSRFVDSSEQRFRDGRGLRRRWVIPLSQLTRVSCSGWPYFSRNNRAKPGALILRIPGPAERVAGCRFEEDQLEALAHGEFDGRTEVTIVGPPV